MIIFNENLSDKSLEEKTKQQISPLFEKLYNLTKDGKIDWKKIERNSPYETSIIKEDNEQWHIKIFENFGKNHMLMIEWCHYNGKNKPRYNEKSKIIRTMFYRYDNNYRNLSEIIKISPELLKDCIDLI